MASLEDWNFAIKLYPQSRANLKLKVVALKCVFSNFKDLQPVCRHYGRKIIVARAGNQRPWLRAFLDLL